MLKEQPSQLEMSPKDPDCCTGGDRDTEEKILSVSHCCFLYVTALRAERMKGSEPGATAQETQGSCNGSAAEIGTSRTLLDTAGHPGHLQRLAEDTEPRGDLRPSGEQQG